MSTQFVTTELTVTDITTSLLLLLAYFSAGVAIGAHWWVW
jgi:hypothetical protein